MSPSIGRSDYQIWIPYPSQGLSWRSFFPCLVPHFFPGCLSSLCKFRILKKWSSLPDRCCTREWTRWIVLRDILLWCCVFNDVFFVGDRRRTSIEGCALASCVLLSQTFYFLFLQICGGFGWRGTKRFSKEWRDLERMFGRWLGIMLLCGCLSIRLFITTSLVLFFWIEVLSLLVVSLGFPFTGLFLFFSFFSCTFFYISL